MVCDDTKRVIIIKNIESNLIEEAIIVLKRKPEISGKGLKTVFSRNPESHSHNALIIKEAEDIINNYMKGKKGADFSEIELNLRPCRSKKMLTNTFINFALISGIAGLVYMVCRFF
ncbi:MAG: hypothetical protein GX660_07050 [Clostridiaceae bacterium]|nr:hypothetical protein [Clostridiaceae bacterium]